MCPRALAHLEGEGRGGGALRKPLAHREQQHWQQWRSRPAFRGSGTDRLRVQSNRAVGPLPAGGIPPGTAAMPLARMRKQCSVRCPSWVARSLLSLPPLARLQTCRVLLLACADHQPCSEAPHYRQARGVEAGTYNFLAAHAGAPHLSPRFQVRLGLAESGWGLGGKGLTSLVSWPGLLAWGTPRCPGCAAEGKQAHAGGWGRAPVGACPATPAPPRLVWRSSATPSPPA